MAKSLKDLDGGFGGASMKTLTRSRSITFDQVDSIDGSSAQRMHTKATLFTSGPYTGRLQAKTRAWTGIDLKGFTGAARVKLFNADGVHLATSGWHSVGVDGDSIVIDIFSIGTAAASDRTIDWQEDFPAEIAATVTRLEIEQVHQSKADYEELAKNIGNAIIDHFEKNRQRN